MAPGAGRPAQRAIDGVDRGLIALLAARRRLVRMIVALKRRSGHGAHDAEVPEGIAERARRALTHMLTIGRAERG